MSLLLAEASYVNIQNLGEKGGQRVSYSILRPTFRLLFNGAELFCPFLLLATLANMQKYGAALVTGLMLY